MTDRLADAQIKLERAQRLYVALGDEIVAFLKLRPFRIQDETEPGSEIVGRVVVKRQPPREWGAVIGDIVHNLRAALDYLAWQLVEANGGTPGRDTTFPIHERPDGFAARLRAALAGASSEAHRAVTDLQPFHDPHPADHPLAVLHALDIRDKHQLLLVVGCGIRRMNLTPRGLVVHMEGLTTPVTGFQGGEVLYRLRGEASPGQL